jgi:DNA-3-methyladenine glycosylase I
MNKKRCAWAETNDLFIPYHDKEWGVVSHDDRHLFEMINLEGAQAGLSWLTILKKRENYRKAFDHFDAKKVSKYTEAKKAQLMKNEGIIRNRLKIHATVENAKSFLEVQREFGSFDKYLWQFVEGKPLPHPTTSAALKHAEAISVTMSKQLKKRGFRFVGPTICYAFMQAVGMINDHSPECFRAKKTKR